MAVACPVAAGSVECPHSTITSAGTRRVGAVASAIVIVWMTDVLLPQPSVAVQVRVMAPVPPQPVRYATSVCEMDTAEPELSIAVACPVAAGPVGCPHSTVVPAGAVKVGAVESTTTTVDAWAEQPAEFVTVTLYVPAFAALADEIVGFWRELANPPGPLHA